MEQKVDYILAKVDKLDERLDNVDRTLSVNTELLAVHIKRTDMLEDEVKYVRGHVQFVNTLGKLLAYSVGLAGGIVAILVALHLL